MRNIVRSSSGSLACREWTRSWAGLPQLRAKLQEAQKRGGQSDEQIQAGERYNTQLAQLALSAEKFKG